MVVLRCTRKLLVRLKRGEDLAEVESTTRLGDTGTATSFALAIVTTCSSSASGPDFLSPFRPRDAKRLSVVFPDAVCDVLATVGVSAEDIAEERGQMSEILFGRTRNRSILGTMTAFAFMAQRGNANRAEPESPEELARFLARTPILPLDGDSPIVLTRAVFEDRSTG